ncbi:MAG: c-type cytochrome domain-containing protein, partial [Verrucomicrobiota bacterium]|nr:c-type cytochrome domain-containing protein [Verrucomicrobiota bacterium]
MIQQTIAFGVAVFLLLGISSKAADPYVPGEPVRGDFKNFAQGFLENHCFDCHDEETAKGDLNLVDLGPLDETNAAVWKSVWAQVTLQEMPPKKKSQPDIVD